MEDALNQITGGVDKSEENELDNCLLSKPGNTFPCTEDDVYSAVFGMLSMEDMDKKGISCSSKHMTGPHFVSGPGNKIQVLLDIE